MIDREFLVGIGNSEAAFDGAAELVIRQLLRHRVLTREQLGCSRYRPDIGVVANSGRSYAPRISVGVEKVFFRGIWDVRYLPQEFPTFGVDRRDSLSLIVFGGSSRHQVVGQGWEEVAAIHL